MKLDIIGWIAMVFVLIGSLSLGIMGIFGFDLISLIFGKMGLITRLIYILIGLSGAWLIYGISMERSRRSGLRK